MELNNIFIVCVAAVAIAFFTMISSCQPNSDELAAEAEIIKADTSRDKARLQTVKELVTNGVPPYLARCAAYASTNDHNDSRCRSANEDYMEMLEEQKKK